MTEAKKSIYNTIAWVYSSDFNEDLSTTVYEDTTVVLEKGGKLRIHYLNTASREKIAAKTGKEVEATPLATVEYASPKALQDFQASKGGKAVPKAAAARPSKF